MARYCTNCGDEIRDGTRFCATCGTAVGASTPKAAPGAPTAYVPNSHGASWARPVVVIAALAAVALIASAVLFAVAISHKNSTKPATIDVGGITAVASTTTAPATAAPRLAPALRYRVYIQQLGNIVEQSTRGRGIVGPLVGDVTNCRVAPEDASSQIRAVIDNRTSVLNQLAGLRAAPNATAARVKSLLQQALQSSIDADAQYKAWMDYLYADWYYAQGCPNGAPPTNLSFENARANDANSTSLKTQFVNAFNPIATQFGYRTWQESDF